MSKWSQIFALPSGNGDAVFNKFVGGANGFPTLGAALATAVAGDAILVRTSYVQTAVEIISTSNIYIEFLPNVVVDAQSNKGISLSSVNNVVIVNPNFNFTNSGNSNAVLELLTCTNCKVLNAVYTGNASKTFTRLIDATLSQSCTVDLRANPNGGSYTNAYTNTGSNLLTTVDGTIIETTVGKLRQEDDTTQWTGYPVINSPVEGLIGPGNYSFECTNQSKFLKTGGTGTFDVSSVSEGQSVMIAVSSTGGAYTITWTGPVKWASASVPTPTITAARYDIYNFIKIGGVIFGTAALNMG